MILYRRDDLVYFEDGTDKFWLHISKLSFNDIGSGNVEVILAFFKPIVRETAITSILDESGDAYGPTLQDLIFAFSRGFDTNYQDQTTDAIIAKFNQVTNSTDLNGAVSIGDYDIIVTSATGISIGSYIILFDPTSERFSTFYAVNVVSTTVTLDTPIDFDYPDGTFVDVAITDLAVNGSVTPQVFGLRGTGAPPGVDIDFDLTRIIFQCLTATPVSLDTFGDLAALANGLVFRTRNSRYHNIFNIKTNGELANIMYDWTPYLATNPAQGQDGFISRLTFAGPSKIGVAIRLPIGEDAEMIVQDDLSGLTSFEIVAEGHIVEP